MSNKTLPDNPILITILATLGAELSADLSTLFDIGGIVGAIAAGLISDYSGMSATTCTGMLALAAPAVINFRCTHLRHDFLIPNAFSAADLPTMGCSLSIIQHLSALRCRSACQWPIRTYYYFREC